MFKQTGIVDVTSVAEVVDCAVAFHYLPLPRGRRVAVIGGQGGTGVATADNCYALGLELPAPLGAHRRPPAGGAAAGRHVGRQPDRHRRGLAARPEPVREGHRDRRRRRGHRHDPGDLDAGPGVPRPRGRGGEGHRQAARGLRVRAAGVGAADLRALAAQGVAAYPDPKRAAYVLARMAEYAGFLEARPGGGPGDAPERLAARTIDSRANARYACELRIRTRIRSEHRSR